MYVYIYWDASCAVLTEPSECQALNVPKVFTAISKLRGLYHPMTGSATAIQYLLSSLGRYCRRCIKYGEYDLELGTMYEEQMLSWQPSQGQVKLQGVCDAFRRHVLILLHRICKASVQPGRVEVLSPETIEAQIQARAMEAVKVVSTVGVKSSHHHFQVVPLLTAGSELGKEHAAERE